MCIRAVMALDDFGQMPVDARKFRLGIELVRRRMN
jgi:hypothetical protein